MTPYNPIPLSQSPTDEQTVTGGQAEAAHERPYFTTLYFGYASDLACQTMKQRYPDSLYIGLARLDGWR